MLAELLAACEHLDNEQAVALVGDDDHDPPPAASAALAA